MYAIVKISGKQFKVEKKQKLFVNRLDVAEGKKISFDNVLMVNDGSKLSLGAPNVSGAQVDAKVLKHLKSDKVIVFKKKRRKGYKVRNGHRQAITEIEISDILTGVTKKLAPVKKEVKKEAPANKEAKKAIPKKEKQDLTKLSVAALKDMAKSKGITGLSSMKKADLIKALS
ncbi:MAG: 50S ribosomal protein L21 [Flavobacteriaceae bacterium]|nr:50S ribosomal protein L21 [Flavobacteriaceae bacterium]|tara:strand:- start:17705 stop:18220 length:516 start_codon:yes stop_codon:yes gene_type:complete